MAFIWPTMLFLLLLVPLGIVLYLRLQRRRARLAAKFGSMGLLQAGGRRLGRRRHAPFALFMLGLTVLLLAVARPQTVVSLPRLEGTVILAFDVSGSMAATDMQPNRMEAAKAAAREFVLRQPRSVLVGVVAFSDSGLSVQTPTNDQDLVLAAIGRLAPQRGTSLGEGVLKSVDAIVASRGDPPKIYTNLTPTPEAEPTPAIDDGSAAIVLLTDGENNVAPDPLAAAQYAAEQGVRLYPIGIGSPEGATLEVEGFTVHTQLDERLLRSMAELSQGAYFGAANQEELQAIYDSINLKLVVKPEKTEVTALVAGIGGLALLIGAALSILWLGRMP